MTVTILPIDSFYLDYKQPMRKQILKYKLLVFLLIIMKRTEDFYIRLSKWQQNLIFY